MIWLADGTAFVSLSKVNDAFANGLIWPRLGETNPLVA